MGLPHPPLDHAGAPGEAGADGAEQEPLSGRFATQGSDKFAGIELDDGIGPAPLLPDCTARFQCRTAFQYEGGDHVIFVGEVLAFGGHNASIALRRWTP